MRNLDRLQPFYKDFLQIHCDFPDLRFTQLIINFARWLYTEKGIADMFYIEDARFLMYLKEYAIQMKSVK